MAILSILSRRSAAVLVASACACTPDPDALVVDSSTSGSTDLATGTTGSTSATATATATTTTETDDADTSGGPESSSSSESESSTGEADTVAFHGFVHRFDPKQPIAPIAGAEVCAVSLDPPICTVTDADGAYSLDVAPNDSMLRVEYTATGYLGLHYVTFTTDEDHEVTNFLPDDETAAAFYASCGAEHPEVESAIILHAYRQMGPDSFAYMDGAVMSADAGVGPCYMSDPWQHGAALTDTAAAGLGAAVFTNVPTDAAGLDVTLMAPDLTCQSYLGLVDTETPQVIRVPLAPGLATLLDVVCAP